MANDPESEADARHGERSRTALIAAMLFVFAFAVFGPAIGHELVSYDDLGFVTRNDWVKRGLNWPNIVHAFRATEMANWHPVTWLSFLVDVSFFGTSAWGFHLTNVFLHALNSVLVFTVLRSMTGATWRSACVAAFFALHPMHVESVAWVAERKDVLSAAFWLITTWLYIDWVRRRSEGDVRAWRSYAGMVAAFALGLMAKPMLVTLPCVLLLLDYWPLRRWGAAGEEGSRTVVSLVFEKLPLFALAALDSAITVKAQAQIGAVIELAKIPWHLRVGNAVVAYGAYLAKCIFPSELAVYYPYSAHSAGLVALCAAFLLMLLSLAFASRRRAPYLWVGYLWFLGTLVPVIGLVQVGGQAMADRYTYIPYIGVFIAAIWGLTELLAVGRFRNGTVVAGASLVAMTIVTERQLTYWKNSGTLWGHTVAVTRDNVPAHLGLGYYYSEQPDRLADAIVEYREAARLAPNHTDPHRSLAALLARSPETREESIAEYQTAIRLAPDYLPAYLALGAVAEQVAGHRAEVIAAYEGALRVDPRDADAHNRLGNLLSADPLRRNEAIEHFRAALASDPSRAEIRLNLGATLADAGRVDEALAQYRELVRAKPDFPEGHNNLANALVRTPGRAFEAEAEYQEAIRLKPDYVEARFNYAQLLARVLHRRSDALAQLEEILRLSPDFEPARQFAADLRR